MTNIQQFGHKVQTKSIGNAERVIRLLAEPHLSKDEVDGLIQFIGMQDTIEQRIDDGERGLHGSLELLDTHVSRLVGKALRSTYLRRAA